MFRKKRPKAPGLVSKRAKKPASLFTDAERESFFDLSDAAQIKLGNVRGPARDWVIVGNVTCGKYCSFNGPLNARGRVLIGNYCAFGSYVSLLSGNHRTDMPNQQIWLSARFGFKVPAESRGPVEIGHNVWIGDKVNVLSGVKVGHGAVIAAGTTVTRDVAPFEIVGGAPARVIRKRFTDQVIAQMLELAWWTWDDEMIAKNRAFFEAEIPHDRDVDVIALCKGL